MMNKPNKTTRRESSENQTLVYESDLDKYLSIKAPSETDMMKINLNAANETERVLMSQFMLLATVVLSGYIALIAIDELRKILTGNNIGLILYALGVMATLMSMNYGIRYFFECIKFYESWGKSHHIRSMAIEKFLFTKNRQASDYIQLTQVLHPKNDKLGDVASKKCLILQYRWLGASFVAMIIIISILVWDM